MHRHGPAALGGGGLWRIPLGWACRMAYGYAYLVGNSHCPFCPMDRPCPCGNVDFCNILGVRVPSGPQDFHDCGAFYPVFFGGGGNVPAAALGHYRKLLHGRSLPGCSRELCQHAVTPGVGLLQYSGLCYSVVHILCDPPFERKAGVFEKNGAAHVLAALPAGAVGPYRGES